MLEISVTLTIPGLPEAIDNLARAIGGRARQEGAVTPPHAPAPTPAQTAPTQTAPASPAPAPGRSVTIETISRAGAALCEQGKVEQLLALLDRFGVQAVTQLKNKPAETLNAFAAELRALGAAI